VDDNSVNVTLYSSSATQPVSIYGNTASQNGGAVYIKSSTTAYASLCAQDFSIDANSVESGSGSAIFADTNNGFGAQVYINAFACPTGSSPFASAACVTGTGCNEIADNTGGETVDIEEGGRLQGSRFAARRNQGGDTIYVDTTQSASTGLLVTELDNCLLVDNIESGSVIYLTPPESGNPGQDTQLVVNNCTITHNTVGYPSIFSIVNYVEITNSIIYDPGAEVLFFDGQPSDVTAEYDLVNNSSTLTTGGIVTGVLQGAPTFVDEGGQDYHLVRGSLGVNYAPAGSTTADLDGNTRVVNLPGVPDVYGPMDLGAYEIQSACANSDTIFCDGFDGN
jgi:hypothetical protein